MKEEDAPTRTRVGVQRGKAPRDHKKQNEQVEYVAKKYHLNDKQIKKLHRISSKMGYGIEEILQEALEIKRLSRK